jgi:methionyl-tRNA synthetase
MERGAIKQGSHEGFYSVNEETFFADKDLIKDESTHPPTFKTEMGEKCERIAEKNYLF